MNDLRFAFRQLLKNPGFTAVAVVTLALGIGVNTSMFTGVHVLLMPGLPYPDSNRLVRVFRTTPHSQRWPHSPANFLEQRGQNAIFTHVAAVTSRSVNLSELGQPAERLRAVLATGDLIPMLGIQPRLGRAFLPDEDQPGRNDVVLLNHAFWLRRFNADHDIIGRTLRLDGETMTVVGVMPPEFANRESWGTADLIRPMGFSGSERAVRGNHYLDVFARLRPEVTLAQANAALARLAAHLGQEHPDTNTDSGLRALSLAKSRMDPRGQIMVWLILGLAGFVLLIACANLANLQFARTALRSRELASGLICGSLSHLGSNRAGRGHCCSGAARGLQTAPLQPPTQFVEQRIHHRGDEQRQEQTQALSTNHDDRHGSAFFRAGTGAQRERRHSGHQGERGHEDGAKAIAICLENRGKPFHALASEVVHMIDLENGVFLHHTEQDEQAEGGIEIQRVPGDPEREQREGQGQRQRQQNGERMHQTLVL
jgi:hypothetical protein